MVMMWGVLIWCGSNKLRSFYQNNCHEGGVFYTPFRLRNNLMYIIYRPYEGEVEQNNCTKGTPMHPLDHELNLHDPNQPSSL